MKKRPKIIQRAIEGAGSLSALARGLGITPQSINGWRRIPSDRVLEIERVSGVSRHDLRPDLYPREVTRPLDRAAA